MKQQISIYSDAGGLKHIVGVLIIISLLPIYLSITDMPIFRDIPFFYYLICSCLIALASAGYLFLYYKKDRLVVFDTGLRGYDVQNKGPHYLRWDQMQNIHAEVNSANQSIYIYKGAQVCIWIPLSTISPIELMSDLKAAGQEQSKLATYLKKFV